jgi:hypothetical protein
VHLIDHQEVPIETHRAHQAVLDLQHGEQRLVDGAHGNGRGEKALGALCRPKTFPPLRAGIVIPEGAARVGQERLAVDAHIPRGSEQHRPGSSVWLECPLHGLQNAGIELAGCYAGRQRKVKAIDLAFDIQAHPPGERGLRLAGAGIGLDKQKARALPHFESPGQRFLERGGSKGEDVGECFRLPRLGYRKPDGGERPLRSSLRQSHAILFRALPEGKELGVGADPVGEHHQPRKTMLAFRGRVDGRNSIFERCGESGTGPLREVIERSQRIVPRAGLPELKVVGVGGQPTIDVLLRDRAAMMGDAGDQHLHSLFFSGEPSRHALHQVAPGGRPAGFEPRVEKKPQRLHHVAGCIPRFGARVGLGLKAAVALAEIVQKRDDGQALLGRHGEFGKPPSEIWPLEQGAKNGRDIETMIDEGMK